MSKLKIIFLNQMLAQVTAEKARNPFLIHSVDIKKSWRKNKKLYKHDKMFTIGLCKIT